MPKILFIGGTGIISASCSRLAAERGLDLYLVNRSKTHRQETPVQARLITADIADRKGFADAIGDLTFDAVVDFTCYDPAHAAFDVDFFKGRTGQFVMISTVSVYDREQADVYVTESTPLRNRLWPYAQAKIAIEETVMKAFRDSNFPVTVVRPGHTYSTLIPCAVGPWDDYTIVDRMKRGKKIIVQGDGTTLWTLTHADDFAQGLVGLLGNHRALGHAFHITSDEALTWNRIVAITGEAAGCAPSIIHIPSDVIHRHYPDIGASVLSDKSCNALFDTTKIKRFVPGYQAAIPFHLGIRRALAWFDADERRKRVSASDNEYMDRIIEKYERVLA